MKIAELLFGAADVALDVRTFTVAEALSQPFEVFAIARSEACDLALDTVVGHAAAFRLATGAAPGSGQDRWRVWSGVCSHIEQVRIEADGLSTYSLRIVPNLWRTTQRRGQRIWQHMTVPEIVAKLLGEYDLELELRLLDHDYPRHEYRVQYGESDFAFVSRLLEEAGISYMFEQIPDDEMPQRRERQREQSQGQQSQGQQGQQSQQSQQSQRSQRSQQSQGQQSQQSQGQQSQQSQGQQSQQNQGQQSQQSQQNQGQQSQQSQQNQGQQSQQSQGQQSQQTDGRQGSEQSGHSEREEDLARIRLVLTDQPQSGTERGAGAIRYVGDTEDHPDMPFIAQVRVSHRVRPGRYTVRDFDFRSSPDLQLITSARARISVEERYEQYHYAPGAFLREATGQSGQASKSGDSQVDEQRGRMVSTVGLESERTGRRLVRYRTNVMDLGPGRIFTLVGHPRAELGERAGLLVVRRHIHGSVEELTEMHGEAVFTADPYRPARTTLKPRMCGLQSALVVGPKGEEIHTEAHGRVRIQFHWDREGKHDEHSSCWVRVGQAWAGAGYGMTSIPRVGHEVLVDFFEGDPDQPVIVGRVHNGATRTPYALPEHKTKTSWKSSTSPGSSGSNEITFEDASGREQIYLHAERDLELRVERNEQRAIGVDLGSVVGRDEQHEVKRDQVVLVGGDRTVSVTGVLTTRADAGLQTVASGTSIRCEQGKLVLTNGSSSLVMDGANVYLDVSGSLQLSTGRTLALSGSEITVDGDPNVRLNCGQARRPMAEPLLVDVLLEALERKKKDSSTQQLRLHFDQQKREVPGPVEEAEKQARQQYRDLQKRQPERPQRVRLPQAVNEQLDMGTEIARQKRVSKDRVLEPEEFEQGKRQLREDNEQEKRRLRKLDSDLTLMFREHAGDYVRLALLLRRRHEHEAKRRPARHRDPASTVGRGTRLLPTEALAESSKKHRDDIRKHRRDILAMLDAERERPKEYAGAWMSYVDDYRAAIDDVKQVVADPTDPLPPDNLGVSLDDVGQGPGVADGKGAGGGLHKGAGGVFDPGAGGGLGKGAGAADGEGAGGIFRAGAGAADGQGARGILGQGMGAAAGSAGLVSAPVQMSGAGGAVAQLGSGEALASGAGPIMLTRMGGLAAADVAGTVSPSNVAFLQTPGEGQLMVVPTDTAVALSEAELGSAMVDAQMQGRPVSSAVSEKLSTRGYDVYERVWGDFWGELVRMTPKQGA